MATKPRNPMTRRKASRTTILRLTKKSKMSEYELSSPGSAVLDLLQEPGYGCQLAHEPGHARRYYHTTSPHMHMVSRRLGAVGVARILPLIA